MKKIVNKIGLMVCETVVFLTRNQALLVCPKVPPHIRKTESALGGKYSKKEEIVNQSCSNMCASFKIKKPWHRLWINVHTCDHKFNIYNKNIIIQTDDTANS